MVTGDALTTTSIDVRVASLCTDFEGVGGVTHVSNSEKPVVTALLKVDVIATDLPLDVTVVVQNSGDTDSSEYYYSGFFLSAIDSPGATVDISCSCSHPQGHPCSRDSSDSCSHTAGPSDSCSGFDE